MSIFPPSARTLRRSPEVAKAVCLLFHATGAPFLARTALQGGRLVRELAAKMAATYQRLGREGATCEALPCY